MFYLRDFLKSKMDNKEQFGYIIAVVNRGRNLVFSIFVNEKKELLVSFGDDVWYTLEDIRKTEIQKGKFDKKNFFSTMKVINKSKDYEDLAMRFFKDFKSDRSNFVTMQKIKFVPNLKNG